MPSKVQYCYVSTSTYILCTYTFLQATISHIIVTQMHTETDRHTLSHTDTDTQRQRHTCNERHRHKHTQAETHMHTQRERHMHRESHTHTQSDWTFSMLLHRTISVYLLRESRLTDASFCFLAILAYCVIPLAKWCTAIIPWLLLKERNKYQQTEEQIHHTTSIL